MYHRKRILVFLFALLFVILLGLSGCNDVDMCPKTGRWESEDGTLTFFLTRKPNEALITVDGEQSYYLFGHEYGSNTIELYTIHVPEPSYQGEIISCSESEWVVSIEGKEYHLHRINQTNE